MLTFIDGRDGWRFIDLANSDLDEALAYLAKEGGRLSLFLNARQCADDIVDRIVAHPGAVAVKAIHVLDRIENFRGLEALHWLEKLSVGFADSHVDFTAFPALRSVGGMWSRHWAGLEQCTRLEDFSVSGFDGAFDRIPRLAWLRRITLMFSSCQSLAGIEQAMSLERLELDSCRKLRDIGAVRQCRNTLHSLVIDECKHIQSMEAVSVLENLDELWLTSSGKIDSIAFIASMKRLSLLNLFETKVLDQDLSPCLAHASLREFRSHDDKRYTPRVDEVRARLTERNPPGGGP
jgi:hypothetical protein